MQKGSKNPLASLPAVGKLLADPALARLIDRHGKPLVTEALRELIAELREQGKEDPKRLNGRLTTRAIAVALRARLDPVVRARPQSVINATGVIVHTNLGRSVLSKEAAAAVADATQGYLDLEYDVDAASRGTRFSHLQPLMERLFPGYDFLVVNNNAAAIMLALRALARGKEILVSRGELVEIGGSFRVPDIMETSGGKLKEVGTTNRTKVADFEKAIGKKTGAMLRVHTSNFKIVGFTEAPKISALAKLAKKKKLPLIVDWGSGDLVDLGPLGLHDEMPVNEVLAAGADLVTFSGDKLLGGPQAGFVVGKHEWIAKLKKDPLARVCRLDRILIAALHATLLAYVEDRAFRSIPTLQMLALDKKTIAARAKAIRDQLDDPRVKLVDGVSRTGGGSAPTGKRPTKLLSIAVKGDAGKLEQALREHQPPIIGRIQEHKLLLDLRTVREDQDRLLVKALAKLLKR